jgi:hypothetical protein
MTAGFLAARRRDLDLTVEIAAARAHITPERWRDLERDEGALLFAPLRLAIHIAVALDCQLDALAAGVLAPAKETRP